MPNWKIHLSIAKKIQDKLNYNDSDKELFLLGSILPDINNGYVVNDISKKLTHDFTHFKSDGEAGYKYFYDNYKCYLNNPIVCGYFVHLYTDYFWNNDFYKRIERFNYNKVNKDELRILKQNDFRKYNNKYIDLKLNISDYKRVEEEAKLINRVSITKNDIVSIVNYFNNQKESNNDFRFYSEEDLDKLMEDTINNLSNELLKIGV